MKLQPRDLRLLGHISRFGVLTTRQIAKLLFENIAHTTMMRRLRILESEGYIKRHAGLSDGVYSWSLTISGGECVGDTRPYEHRNMNTLNHSVMLTELRFAIESIGLGKDWIPEWHLKSEIYNPRDHRREQVVPDGILLERINGKPAAVSVELELTPKSINRYEKLFRLYRDKTSIALIWYVVTKKNFGLRILDTWSNIFKMYDNPTLGLSVLNDVIANPRDAKMYFKNRTTTIAKMFLVDDLTINEPAHSDTQGVSSSEQLNPSYANQNLSKGNQEDNPDHSASIEQPSTPDPSPSTSDGKGSGLTGCRSAA